MDANDYAHLPLGQLADAANALAEELRQVTTRTPEERAALVQRCMMLLIGMARTIDPSPYVPHKPEQNLDPRNLVSAFAAYAKDQCDNVRYHVMKRAADFAFGQHARTYFRARHTWELKDGVAVNVAFGSDEALLATLKDIAEQREAMPAHLRR